MSFKALDTTILKTNTILAEIEQELWWESREYSYKALRSVLHTLRDRLPADTAAAFASQLTLLIKGIYFDGWNPGAGVIKMDREQFREKVFQELSIKEDAIDFDIEDLIQVVMVAIRNSIDPHEVEKLRNVLPEDVAELITA